MLQRNSNSAIDPPKVGRNSCRPAKAQPVKLANHVQTGTVALGKATSWLWASDCRSCSLAWGLGCMCDGRAGAGWMNELGCQLVCSKIGSESTEVHHNSEIVE
jgi:hypothetical protein